MWAPSLRRGVLTILVIIGLAVSGAQSVAFANIDLGGMAFEAMEKADTHECEEHGASHAVKHGGHCCVSGSSGYAPTLAEFSGILPIDSDRIFGADDRAPTSRNIAIFKPPQFSWQLSGVRSWFAKIPRKS